MYTFGAPAADPAVLRSDVRRELSMHDKLKALYNKQDKIPQLIALLDDEDKQQSDKDKRQSIADYYVNLNIVLSEGEGGASASESISGKKEPIQLEEILSPKKQGNVDASTASSGKVLILGGAGVGKSTLMQHIAYQWAQGKLWSKKFDAVYKVSFKQYLVGTCEDFIKNKVNKESHKDHALEAFIAFSLGENNEASASEHFDTLTTTKSLQSDRTLLLVDGYDEVQHLDEQKGSETTTYGHLKKAVFSYPRLIMTTRPNAATYDIKRRFDYLVENEGLGNDGIEKYLEKQFAGSKYSTLTPKVSTFLRQNPTLRAICHVPVNISMLCSVIKDQQSANKGDTLDQDLSKLTTMGALYKEMLTTLSKRFVTKTGSKYSRGKESTELRDQINNGELTLIEMKVLEYIAHDRFTTPNGLVFDGDTYLRRGIEQVSQAQNVRFNEKPTRRDLWKLGLLKKELTRGEKGKAEENLTQREHLEREDLAQQLFSFVHLTFQEYLTAYHIRSLLISDIQSKNTAGYRATCAFIATHRDEPKYLMTWKFLSGLVDNMDVYVDIAGDSKKIKDAEEELKGQVRQAFWESMLCNLDGVIDLGEDSRITLFMHLLGQVSKKGRESVKALKCAKELENFIYEVVSKDLEKWVETITASGYLSEGMETKLMKLVEAQETQKPGFKLASEVFLLLKKDNQTKLVRKLMDQLGHDLDAYIHLSRVASTFIWDNIESAEYEALILQLLDGLAHPDNAPVSQEISKMLAVLSALNEKIVKKVVDRLIELLEKGGYDAKSAIRALGELPLKEKCDGRIVQDWAGKLIGLLGKGGDVAEYASEALGRLPLKENYDKNTVQDWAGKLIGLLEDEDVAESAVFALGELSLAKCDEKTVQDWAGKLIGLLEKGRNIARFAYEALGELPLKEKCDKNTIQDWAAQLIELLEKGGDVARAALHALGALPLKEKCDKNTIQDWAGKLIGLLENEDEDVARSAARALGALPLKEKCDENTVQDWAGKLIELLEKGEDVARSAARALGALPLKEKCDENTVQDWAGKLIGLLEKRGDVARFAFDALGKLPLEKCDEKTVQDWAGKLIGLLEKGGDVAESASKALGALPLEENCDEKIVQDWAGKLIGLLEKGGSVARFAVEALGELPLKEKCDGRIVQDWADQLIELLENENKNIVYYAFEISGKLPLEKCDEKIVQEVAGKLIGLLEEGGSVARFAVEALGELPLEEKCDKNTVQDWADQLVELLEDEYVAESASKALGRLPLKEKCDKKIVQDWAGKPIGLLEKEGVIARSAIFALNELPLAKCDEKIVQEVVGKLIGLLEDESVTYYATEAFGKLPLEKCDEKIVQEVAGKLIGLLENEDEYVAESASEALGKLPLEKCDKNTVQDWAGKLIGLLENEDEDIAEYATDAVYGIVSNSNFRTIKYFSSSYLTHPKLEALPEKILEKLASPPSTFEEVYSLLAFERILPKDNKSWTQVRDEIPTAVNAYWDSLIRPLSGKKKEESAELSSKEGMDERDKKQEKSVTDKEDINKKLGALYEKLVANLEKKEEANLSKEENISRTPLGRRFLSRVYHHILSDRKIDDTELNLMQQLIQSGFTTSIAVIEVKEDGAPQGENEEATPQDRGVSKKERYSVTFNGRTYTLADNFSEKNLRTIVNATLDAVKRDPTQDRLIRQYVDYTPVFPNSGKYLLKSSSDVQSEEVVSVFDHRPVSKENLVTLSPNVQEKPPVIVTKLADSRDRSNIRFYKEYRDFLGRHVIEHYTYVEEDASTKPSKSWEEYVKSMEDRPLVSVSSYAFNPNLLHCDRDKPDDITRETRATLSQIFEDYKEGEAKHARPYTVSLKKVARAVSDLKATAGNKKYTMDEPVESEAYLRIVTHSFLLPASELSEERGFISSVGNTWLFHQSLVGMLNGGKIAMNTYIARKSGMFGKTELSEAYDTLEHEDIEGYHYAKAFSLTLSSYISAHSQDVGLYVQEEPDNLISESIGKVATAIPMIGNAADVLISGINWAAKQEETLEQEVRMKKLKTVARYSFTTNEDLWLFSGHAGLSMWEAKQSQPSTSDIVPQGRRAKIRAQIISFKDKVQSRVDAGMDKFEEAKAKIVERVSGIQSTDAHADIANEAIADAASFLGEICKLPGNKLTEDTIKVLVAKVVGEEDATEPVDTAAAPTPTDQASPSDESEIIVSSSGCFDRLLSRFYNQPDAAR